MKISVSIAYHRPISPHRLTMGFLKIAAVTLALCSAVSQASVLPRAPGIVETDFDVLIVGGGPAGLSALSGVSRVRRTALLLDGGQYRNGDTRHMHDVIGNDGKCPLLPQRHIKSNLMFPICRHCSRTIQRVSP